jgi:hypothetical protein
MRLRIIGPGVRPTDTRTRRHRIAGRTQYSTGARLTHPSRPFGATRAGSARAGSGWSMQRGRD